MQVCIGSTAACHLFIVTHCVQPKLRQQEQQQLCLQMHFPVFAHLAREERHVPAKLCLRIHLAFVLDGESLKCSFFFFFVNCLNKNLDSGSSSGEKVSHIWN